MTYAVTFDSQVEGDIVKHIKAGNKKLVGRIDILVKELTEHPRNGTGKPEQLKNYSVETWSRRIDDKHRLVYEIHDNELMVIAISAYGHYGNK